MTNKIIVLVLAILFSCSAVAKLTQEQKTAKEKGIALYQQSDWYDSQPLLEKAAMAGDRTAQYYLAEAIRLSRRYTTAEARKWYEAAAEQGDLYAMLRLSSKSDFCNDLENCTGKRAEEWREQLLSTAHERAEKGDTEAMTALFITKQGLRWLVKAAKAGDPLAQNTLAGIYKDGDGWFLIPGSREKAVEKLYRASAEGGYPRAMYLYANYLYEHSSEKKEVAYWLKKSAEHGYIEAVGNYALSIAHLPNNLDYNKNLIEAYGLAYLMSKLEGGGTAPEDGKWILTKISENMTTEEIKKGILFAKEWEKSHPPLSYFVPIYGY
ncbi:tetratricopeptide repeat protein [Pseudomonas sp. C2B4]|uniref:tetratricopeptide repeat protein n=1 Tax=Pseudomonas sp. C2B4 TaxID=2735270 RepID=UPI0015861750|nr:sel1 repeat family protein [Pseudomonas sp. C2B4]NUU38765.1 sel1 repeat family protein [Pseudomonas sp. C2B4]